MKSFRNWWIAYVACSALLLAVTSWITVRVLDLEDRELALKAAAEIQEDTRLALWRMDSRNDSLLAGESSRAFFHYRAYYPQQRAYTRLLEAFAPGDLLVPSPLLAHDSSIVLLHMQRESDGRWTSPQVPEGNLRDLAEAGGVDGAQIEARADLLARVAASMGRQQEGVQVAQFGATQAVLDEDRLELSTLTSPAQLVAPAPTVRLAEAQDDDLRQVLVDKEVDERSLKEYEARGRWLDNKRNIAQQAQKGADMTIASEVQDVLVSPFTPRWVDAGEPLLVFERDVQVGSAVHEQAFVVDFSMLAGQLLEDVADLFPSAGLRPIVPGAALEGTDASHLLATLPAVLEPGRRPVMARAGMTPMRMAMLITWLAVVGVIVVVGITLRSIIAHARRRMRFASAVTHELRTPLTTFQLYSELLDEGAVSDEATRREYHRTLRRESGRLGRLVENVLAYARLEDGRHVTQRETLSVRSVMDRVLPSIRDRVEAAGMAFVGPDDLDSCDTEVTTSPDVVEQILGNLAENACKYGASPVSIEVDVRPEVVRLEVSDAGEGVPQAMAQRVFEPFDRGHLEGGDPTSGVGLGLALSRELARDLGGGLSLKAGAMSTFVLSLPR